MKRIALAGTFLLFAAFGVGMALFGAQGDRVMGIAVAMMFGGGGLAWWMVNRRRDVRMLGLQIGLVAGAGGSEPAFVARSDRTVLIASVVGCFAFGAGMVLMLVAGDAVDLDLLETVVIAGGGLLIIGVGLFGLLRMLNNSHFALTRRGLHAIGPAGWFVPWESIAATDVIVVHDNPFLGVHVRDQDAIRVSALQRVGHGFQRSVLGVDLTVPIRTLTVHPDEMVGAIERYRQHPEYRSRIGRADELALIRTIAPPPAAVPGERDRGALRAAAPRRRILRTLAIGSLFLVGAFCVLLLTTFDDQARPGRELLRFVSFIVLSAVAVGQLAAGVLLLRGIAVGRTLAIASSVAMIALIVLALAFGAPDSRPIGLGLLAVIGSQLLIVVQAARVNRSPVDQPDSIGTVIR